MSTSSHRSESLLRILVVRRTGRASGSKRLRGHKAEEIA